MKTQHTPFKLEPGELGLISDPQRKAYVIRAVNAHEVLLTHLKDALKSFRKKSYPSVLWFEIVEQAIARAEGKE